MKQFKKSMDELIVKASTQLPQDVKALIQMAQTREDAKTRSAMALDVIAHNNELADLKISPICQDTGMPTFKVNVPVGTNQIEMAKEIRAAIVRATEQAILRPNTVDPLTGKNNGYNLGDGAPIIKFEQWEKDEIEVRLILKGGGCENKNIQYSLPCTLEGLGRADRDLDGVRKCILHAVYQAQGHGCGPGFVGVGIGGDRTSGYELAKEQLFRELSDVNTNEQLRTLETYIEDKANVLGIGTMGFGGETSLLACKIGVAHRLPASFFVSVAYNCWAFRRLGICLSSETGAIKNWLYQSKMPKKVGPEVVAHDVPAEENVIQLRTPILEEAIRNLSVGDVVSISGRIYTGRDAIHKHLFKADVAAVNLQDQVIYHCGPVVAKNKAGEWEIKAAGPTTSIREEPYQSEIIKKFGLRVVIGKGGMGQKTLQGLKTHGGIYLNAIGGAAQYYATCIDEVVGVDYLEFGLPEAMWHLKVTDFKAVVTMDAHGNSLHEAVEQTSLEKLATLKENIF